MLEFKLIDDDTFEIKSSMLGAIRTKVDTFKQSISGMTEWYTKHHGHKIEVLQRAKRMGITNVIYVSGDASCRGNGLKRERVR